MSEKLTAKQAATILGYHVRHVHRLLKQGKLKGERFNRVWMVDAEGVERLKTQQNESGRLPRRSRRP
jgi:excisionase family DNA binding protein